jgi:pimeloyl-ACP methyl ester carboxylesterase
MSRLVFMHGLGGGHAAWDEQVEHFRGLGYECEAWDQPGYGATPLPEPYTLDTVTAALKALLANRKAVLIGHSMGGLIAQEAYARFPELVDALALTFTSAAFVGTSDFAAKFIAERLEPLDRGESMAQVASRVMPAMSGRVAAEDALDKAKAIMSTLRPETYRKAVHLLTTIDRRADLPKIAVPTLLVAGSDDRTAPPSIMEKMAAKIPRSEYVLLRDCGHLGPMDQPRQFNAVLEQFLRKNGL